MAITNWEYHIVSLASFDAAQAAPDAHPPGAVLNAYGLQGWEAVGFTTAASGESSVMMKRPLAQGRASGGRM